MNRDEWDKLTKEDLTHLSEEEFLKHLIKFTDERYMDYKKQLEDVHKDKISFPPESESTIWFKDFLREQKNYEESNLKEKRIEMEYLRAGMNPPYCYPKH